MPATPVNVDVGLLGVVTVPPAPLTMLHAPVPLVGVLAAKVTLVPQTVWSGPAFEVVGAGTTVTVTLAQVVVLHVPDARTKYVVVVAGFTVMLGPEPAAVPPQEPVNH